MRAIITVMGKDTVGIFAATTTQLAKANVNIVEVTQSVLDEYFAMIMLVDIDKMEISLDELKQRLVDNVDSMQIHVMHEDIFNSMHRI